MQRSLRAVRSRQLSRRFPAVKVKFLLEIPTFGAGMHVTEKGQVTIPKHIRLAAGVVAGSEVSFSLEGGKIVITRLATGVKDDRRAKLRAAAARVRASLSPEFKQLGADEIMGFLRGDEAAPATSRRGRR
jgi:antitoxin PrlF